MAGNKKWWTCPSCKSYKMLSDANTNCIRCSNCGRFYNAKGQEISVNVDLYTLTSHEKCDVS